MAKFNSAWLIHKQQFRSLTGVEPYTFLELVERLRPHWRERIEAPKNRSGRPGGVSGVENHLLVLLILYRCAITQDFMACLYQTNKSTISRSLRRIEAVAARVLGVTRVVHVSREEAEALIIDCMEQSIPRGARVLEWRLTHPALDQLLRQHHQVPRPRARRCGRRDAPARIAVQIGQQPPGG